MVSRRSMKSQFMKRNEGHCHCGHSGHAVYGLGFVGSAVYFISTAASFWIGVLGILKAIVWPAVLVYGLLKFLGM